MKVQSTYQSTKPRVRSPRPLVLESSNSDLLIVSEDPTDLTPFKAGQATICTQNDFQALPVRQACRVLLLMGPSQQTLDKITKLWPDGGPLVLAVGAVESRVPNSEFIYFSKAEASKDSFLTLVRGLIRERNERQAHDLLARITHDMRSPMSVIKMACQFIRRESQEDENLQYIQMVEESSNEIQTLIGDILDYSKLNQGSVSLHVTQFDLPALLRSVLDATRLLVKGKDIDVQGEFCPGLPGTVSGDPGRLRQILGNLLGNAVKFTEKGQVELRARLIDGTCYFEVSDTGIGIAPSALEHIFRPYRQADSSIIGRYGGTGLGLNICKLLVERMGGQIDVRSEQGLGSLFYFHIELPEVKREQMDLETLQWDQLQLWQVGESSPEAWVHPFEELGVTIRSFGTGHEVAQRALLSNPDLLVFNLENGGFGELRRILDCFPKKTPRVIVVTTLGQRGDGARCKSLGVGGYLTTPFGFDDLRMTIQLVMRAEPGELITKHTLKEQAAKSH